MSRFLGGLFSLIFLISYTSAQNGTSAWPGWSQIRQLFIFGDSYTTTGFSTNSTQPNPSNPLGNPEFPGRTFSNGRNWVDFLALQYNASYLNVYNFARPGAVVDTFGRPSPIPPMSVQVTNTFLPNYSTRQANGGGNGVGKLGIQWSSKDTLFASFFGINDVNLSYKSGNNSANTATIASYSRLVDRLYQSGARNFLFLNVPAVNRAPFTVDQGNNSMQLAEMNRRAILDFNMRISNMAQRLVQQHADATAFVFDTFALFNEVLDNPRSREETAGYTNTTGFCFSYSRRTYNEDQFNETCGIPQKEYFWLDPLHPTPPIHNAMAVDIASQLNNNEFIGNNATRPAIFTGSSSRTLPISHTSSISYIVGYMALFWAIALL